MPIAIYTRIEGGVGRCPTPRQGETPPAPADAPAARLDVHDGTGVGTCAGCRDWMEHGPFGMAFCRRFGLQPRNTARCGRWRPEEGGRQ